MSRNRLARLNVLSASELGPSMRRVVFGGEGVNELAGRWSGFTDSYVKIVFLTPGVTYPDTLDLDQLKAQTDPEHWPALRTYTIRRLLPDTGEIWVDFVTHGAEGLAGPWAQGAEPGDSILVRGPGGAYRPDPGADHHLLVGDESALPAIAASLESLRPGQRATAFIEIDGPADEQEIVSPGDVDLHWLHRAPAAAGTTSLLDDAVRAWDWPLGRVQAFVHGESRLLKTVRPYVARDRAVPRADLSVSAYWRLGETEEGFRSWKQSERDRGEDPLWRPTP